MWGFKGAEFKSFFCAKTTPSLCFGLIFVRGKLNLANGSVLNFQKYAPLLPTSITVGYHFMI